jgi:hypothetical protein
MQGSRIAKDCVLYAVDHRPVLALGGLESLGTRSRDKTA